MTPEHARELLGGLAAGILTPEERQTLFEAALHDQALFNEVADELEFAVFLQSPETRAQLANRIEVEPERRPWWALRPAWLAVSGVLAASTVLYVALWRPGDIAQPSAPAMQTATETAKNETAPKTATMARPVTSVTAHTAKPKPARVDKLAEPVAETVQAMRARPAAPPRAVAPAPGSAFSAAPERSAAEKKTTASLTGTVHDSSGAAVAGADVDIVDTSTNSTTHMATDANGRFVALSLPQNGPYTVIAAAPGFKKEQRSVTLDGSQPAEIDIPLQVGEMAETVAVTAAAPAAPMPPASQSLTQIAVLDFANGSGQQSGAQVADLLSSQLLNGGQFGVIDRGRVQQAVQSQNATGRPQTAKDAAALGRSIGADAVIVGSVQASGAAGGGGFAKRKAVTNVFLTAEVIDTKQAEAMMKAAANGASLQGATNDLGNQLQSKLTKPVEGSVTHLTGDIVSVRFVEPPGLRIGARCDVVRGTRKIGELMITSVNGQYAVGKFSGTGQPREGDRVTTSR